MKRLTEKEAARFIVWFQARLGMQDWTWEIGVQDNPPDWIKLCSRGDVAACVCDARDKKAKVWISPARATGYRDQLVSLAHEAMHAVAVDVGISGDETPRKEYLWDCLGAVLAAAFEKE